ncbi:PKD domain-containing protein [Robertkochia sediminum]|uniref:PKD domain-containing protein n=1 Tax=Robertkochia sediminum TaxID=2785326 RepID=UPI001931DBD2|nr:PKD domain-containing protein [Robertkochia sediminum]MBL7474101.1 PKD domain-containing protein [Robertkochia sediminum]
MKTLNIISKLFLLIFFAAFTACDDDEDFAATPPTSEDAAYSFTFDEENPNKVHFKAEPGKETWYTHWDFGDNSAAEGLEASKVYLKKGDYDVRFKIFTDGGTAESVQTVVINQDFEGPNVLQNGEFEGSDPWTILPISDGVAVNFDNGEARWTGGGWGQQGIYQAFSVLPDNLYQISMDIKGGPLTDSWFEVYVGMEAPVPGQDYADGGARLALNTWAGCGGEPFDGDFVEINCAGSGPTFEFATGGTAYLVIRGGGADYGANGVSIDNVAIRSLESTEVAPPPLAASFTSSLEGLTATFTNASVNATSYSWDFGDGAGTSTDENPSYTYNEGGTYTVTLTASNDTESVQFTETITVTDPNAAPEVGFTSSISGLEVTFTNTTTNAVSYAWDFGDGMGTSADENPVYAYQQAGTYTVTLTATSEGGATGEFTADVTVEEITSSTNFINNGSFDDDAGWTVTNHYEVANTLGSVTIADGAVKIDETEAGPWKHVGLYTAVTLEPGIYQFEMDMTYTEINDVWGEVYIGTQEPQQNVDYSGDQRVLVAYNAWDCADAKTYNGKATESGCDPEANPGQFEITAAGTYYLLFRTGGATYGPDGIVIDNMSLLKVN